MKSQSLTCAVILAVSLLAEAAYSQTVTNWGPTRNGVQLSIMKLAILLTLCFVTVFGMGVGKCQSGIISTDTNSLGFNAHPWKGEQPKLPAGATNWGMNVRDVGLLIYSTNDVINPGSTIVVLAALTNASTNVISVDRTAPEIGFKLVLTDRAGKLYDLTREPALGSARDDEMIVPGEQTVKRLTVEFGNDIDPGDYMLEATREFSVSGEKCKLTSNVLKVRIK